MVLLSQPLSHLPGYLLAGLLALILLVLDMKTRTFRVYSDPDSAWVKVSIPFLVKIIGLQWRQYFTSLSRERGDYAYLAQGQDASFFVECCSAAGIKAVFTNGSICVSRSSRIYFYPALNPVELSILPLTINTD